MKTILLIDIGSTFTKVTAVDMDRECILGTARAFTTVRTDVNEGLQKALDILYEQTGIREYDARYACSSAAGGLKMIAIGLVPDLTAETARIAALSAGARVLKTYSYELGKEDAEEIKNLKPDIILLSGGTDGGNKRVVLHNASVLQAIDGEFSVLIAGNRCAAEEAHALLEMPDREVRVCENVMPEFNVLNIEPARDAIRELFLKRIIRAKGLTKVQELIEGILMPTPSAVFAAARLLSEGFGTEKGLGDLLLVDVGGATTDVYSMTEGKPDQAGVQVKGLPEPYAKRTVEGDLGVRYSAGALVEAAGMEAVAGKAGLKKEEVACLMERINKEPELTGSLNGNIGRLDFGLAAMAVRLSVGRHAGKLETAYTPFGPVFIQTGRNLTKIRTVIGTGGPVIGSMNPVGILQEVLWNEEMDSNMTLRPKEADFLLDKKYILAAMGLLGRIYPEAAVRIMKKELVH